MGEFDKQVREISNSITEVKKDTQKLLDQQDTILKILKKKDRELLDGNLPKELSDLFTNYEKEIAHVDFRLDIPKIKKDIEKSTKKFLKGKK